MPLTTLSRCVQCEAVVNIHWPACMVCRAILPRDPQLSTSTEITPDTARPALSPIAPLQPGWIVAHRDQAGNLRGGCKDKARAIFPMTEPTVPTVTPNRSAFSHAASAIQSFEVQPAVSNAQPIYWETGTGHILGPAVPEFLARDGGSFWISTTFEGQIRWINTDRLRSRKAFLQQAEVREIELIRSF